MPKLPPARDGNLLKIKKRHVQFSFWPVRRRSRRYGLQSRVFASDPWSVIRHSIDERKLTALAKDQAQAFGAQAHDYFKAAEVAGLFTTKPVLLYYCFLNLVKAYVLATGYRSNYDIAYHGLKERRDGLARELLDSYLEAIPSTATNVNIFADFLAALTGHRLAVKKTYRIPHILPQLLQGHRIWCTAADQQERFIALAKIELLQSSDSKKLWTVLNIYEEDLTRLGITRSQLIRETGLADDYHEVASSDSVSDRHILKFEKVVPITYTHRPSDVVNDLVASVKGQIWSNVLSIPPYRKYYVYTAPSNEKTSVMPQLLSLFAFFYYLGSVTRYRPQQVRGLVAGPFGGQLEEAIINLPSQFLYLMASELSRQDVTRGAIV
ncbi:MAG: YaaC family protein [Candidatus Zixiibacteriota bacterium]